MTGSFRAPGFETFGLDEIDDLESKREVAARIADRFRDGEVVGAGSGSTSFLVVSELAARRARGELPNVRLCPTSTETELTCARFGIGVSPLSARAPDWAFDGADEVDPAGDMIKGRGGALLREKLVFLAAPVRRVAVDRSKLVPRLGTRFAVPVEVFPEALPVAWAELERAGAVEVVVRRGSGKDGPVFTENRNLLLDCRFAEIAEGLEVRLRAIPGVVESGLFQGYAPEIVTA